MVPTSTSPTHEEPRLAVLAPPPRLRPPPPVAPQAAARCNGRSDQPGGPGSHQPPTRSMSPNRAKTARLRDLTPAGCFGRWWDRARGGSRRARRAAAARVVPRRGRRRTGHRRRRVGRLRHGRAARCQLRPRDAARARLTAQYASATCPRAMVLSAPSLGRSGLYVVGSRDGDRRNAVARSGCQGAVERCSRM